jgi:hypothetical protein
LQSLKIAFAKRKALKRDARTKEELEGIKFYDKDGTEIVRCTDTENLSPLLAGQQQKTEVVTSFYDPRRSNHLIATDPEKSCKGVDVQ